MNTLTTLRDALHAVANNVEQSEMNVLEATLTALKILGEDADMMPEYQNNVRAEIELRKAAAMLEYRSERLLLGDMAFTEDNLNDIRYNRFTVGQVIRGKRLTLRDVHIITMFANLNKEHGAYDDLVAYAKTRRRYEKAVAARANFEAAVKS